MFNNTKILILGMARSGFSVAKLLRKYNNDIIITDNKPQDSTSIDILKDLNIPFILSDNPESLIDTSFDFIIKNPGISPKHKVCLKAKELNIPITNEMEVAYSLLPKNIKIVGITGSNGKTTTTTLTYEFLKKAGLPVHIGGNIGIPLCDLIPDIKNNDILVLEISSHQLNDFINFKTNISVITNLNPVHIDHFGSFENYISKKLRIFQRHTKDDITILNFLDNESMKYVDYINSKKIFFSSKSLADIYIKDNSIYYGNEEIIKTSNILLKGLHNYENIMCGILISKVFGVKNEIFSEVLKNFNGVAHRLEFVSCINNRSFYNDSKATNTKSTQIALSSFSTPTILIMGGLDRNHSFYELKDYMSNVKKIICYGETKYRIKEFADTIKVDCHIVDTLKTAVPLSYELSSEGDTIVLSPACASWDQYKSFEARGNEFKSIVKGLRT